jgi:hypothetical protein
MRIVFYLLVVTITLGGATRSIGWQAQPRDGSDRVSPRARTARPTGHSIGAALFNRPCFAR